MSARPLRRALVCAALALAGCSPEMDWRVLSPPEGRFSVLLPCKPQRASRALHAASGAQTMTQYACSLRAGTMGAAYTDAPGAAPGAEAARARVDAARDALLRNIGAGVHSEEEVSVGGMRGRQVYAEGRAGGQEVVLKARFVVAGDRVYQVAYVGARDAIAADDVDMFLTSFKLLR